MCVVVRSRSAEWHCPSDYIHIWSCNHFFPFFCTLSSPTSKRSSYSRRYYLLLGIDKVSQRRAAWNHMYIVKSSCVNFIAGKKIFINLHMIWRERGFFRVSFLQIIFYLFRRGHTLTHTRSMYTKIWSHTMSAGSNWFSVLAEKLAKNYKQSMERPRSQIKAPIYGFIQSPIVCVRSASKKQQHKRNRQWPTLRTNFIGNCIWTCFVFHCDGFYVFALRLQLQTATTTTIAHRCWKTKRKPYIAGWH